METRDDLAQWAERELGVAVRQLAAFVRDLDRGVAFKVFTYQADQAMVAAARQRALETLLDWIEGRRPDHVVKLVLARVVQTGAAAASTSACANLMAAKEHAVWVEVMERLLPDGE